MSPPLPAATLAAPDSKYQNAPVEQTGWPKGIPFIVGNELCERFSFYGMKAILWVYTAGLLAQRLSKEAADAQATQVVHFFNAGVYAFPMIGAIVADRLLGKYNTILWVSMIYCAGHAVLSVADIAPAMVGGTEFGLYLGLALIAIGSGGIKPCVSAHVGDQFGQGNAHLVPRVYQIFYFSINFGSFFSTLLIPVLLDKAGPAVAFGIPGVLMFIATIVFWMGRHRFVHIPPKPGGRLGLLDTLAGTALFMTVGSLFFTASQSLTVKIVAAAASLALWAVLFLVRENIEPSGGFFSVLFYSLKNRAKGAGQFLSAARARFGDEAAEGPMAVVRISFVLVMVSVFWALFDQHASSWVNQAAQMKLVVDLPLFGPTKFLESQISALNPLMVMAIIPAMEFGVYRPLQRAGVKVTPLRKMTVGMFVASLSFVIVALVQMRIDGSPANTVSVLWQIAPYLVITTSEVLVSITGLEFCYTQAPRSMKSTVMGLWLLTVSFGNLLVAFLAGFESLSLANFFWVFAGLMAAAALVFGTIAYFYKGKTYLQDAATA